MGGFMLINTRKQAHPPHTPPALNVTTERRR
jgi:hypothetical protein